jgi:hypothetical protein
MSVLLMATIFHGNLPASWKKLTWPDKPQLSAKDALGSPGAKASRQEIPDPAFHGLIQSAYIGGPFYETGCAFVERLVQAVSGT